MRVLLISNWSDQCGISMYGNNLLLALNALDDVEVVPVEIGSSSSKLLKATENVDVVHLNHQPYVNRDFYPYEWIDDCTKPIILTNHYSDWIESWYKDLAGVVIHQSETEELQKKLKAKVRYIPMGVVNTQLSDSEVEGIAIGQAGLPGPRKKAEEICHAAVELTKRGYDVRVFMIAPLTYKTEPNAHIEEWKEILGEEISLTVITQWLDEYEVIRLLHDNLSICVHPGGAAPSRGSSSSVRLGIAAHRPVVVNAEDVLFKDIIGVEGVYSYIGAENLVDAIIEAYGGVGPEAYAADNSYQEIIKKYVSLYKEVM